MPKTKVATCQKETQKSLIVAILEEKAEGHAAIVQPAARHSPHPSAAIKSKGRNAINQQSDATPVTSNQSPTPRTRQQNGRKTANSRTARQQEMPGAPQPNQRRQE